jgi:hypothetical protein
VIPRGNGLRALCTLVILATIVIALIAPRLVWYAIGALIAVLAAVLFAYEQESRLFGAANRALFLALGQLEEQQQPRPPAPALTPEADPVVWDWDCSMN